RWYRMAAAATLPRAEWIAASYADGNPRRFTQRPLAEWAPYRARVAAELVNAGGEAVRQALAYERLTHLPAIVATGDRLTMAAPIEARLPFADPRLLDFAGRAPTADLFRGRHGKQLLREAMAERLPAQVLARRKRGWASPFAAYLREDPRLRPWLARVPDHPIVAASELGQPRARRAIDTFLDGDNTHTRDAWMLGRIVLWHQVCVEDRRQLFEQAAA
ncbi:MAG TPA: asparagine synthase-related protein, partial [Candidatus Limnocylindrales bacterium]